MANEKEESVLIQVPKDDEKKAEEEEEEEEVFALGRGKKKKKQEEGLKPWEQHSAVISIPRYDYKAPSSLLERSHSGFLITCPIKREKSATKEAISILEKFVGSMHSNRCLGLEFFCTNTATKKRKVVSKVADAENVESAESNEDGNGSEISSKVAGEVSLEVSDNVESSVNSLSLVKLTRSGLLLFTFPSNNFCHVVGVLSNILVSLGSGNMKRPLWCNRIFPIQETCILSEKNLEMVVSKLVQEYLGKDHTNLGRPIKVVVLVELLPLSGVPHESVVVGVSILPPELINTKPKLCVKPLVSDAKPTKKRD